MVTFKGIQKFDICIFKWITVWSVFPQYNLPGQQAPKKENTVMPCNNEPETHFSPFHQTISANEERQKQ